MTGDEAAEKAREVVVMVTLQAPPRETRQGITPEPKPVIHQTVISLEGSYRGLLDGSLEYMLRDVMQHTAYEIFKKISNPEE